MKLSFSKDSKGNINVKMIHETKEYPFNYVNFIKVIYSRKFDFEAPEFIGEITEEEQTKLKDMVQQMKEVVLASTI